MNATRVPTGPARQAALLALAACGSVTLAPAIGTAAPTERPPGSVTATSTGSEAGDEHPKRRAGLWEVETTGGHAAGLPAAQYCVDDATDRPTHHLDRTFGAKGACRFGAFKRSVDGWLSETICREGRTVITTRSLATGDFLTAYRIDTLVSYEPPLGGVRREERTASAARWLGACRPGQQAGDLALPGMGRINMKDGSVAPDAGTRKDAPKRRFSKQADG